MTHPILVVPVTLPAGEIVATHVSAEDYRAHYAADHHEWVNGVVINMAAATVQHYVIGQYLSNLFQVYFRLNPIASRREPDLQIILHDNPSQFTDTELIGAADICIEIVSEESISRDYGDKFQEYQKGGVHEYWLIDSLREDALFYRLNDKGVYLHHEPDSAGYYQAALLPHLKFHVPTLWLPQLPDILQVVETVRAMFPTSH